MLSTGLQHDLQVLYIIVFFKVTLIDTFLYYNYFHVCNNKCLELFYYRIVRDMLREIFCNIILIFTRSDF